MRDILVLIIHFNKAFCMLITHNITKPEDLTAHPTWFVKDEIITYMKGRGVDTSLVYLKRAGSLTKIYFKELCKDTFVEVQYNG